LVTDFGLSAQIPESSVHSRKQALNQPGFPETSLSCSWQVYILIVRLPIGMPFAFFSQSV
jgi:hypothetical protein